MYEIIGTNKQKFSGNGAWRNEPQVYDTADTLKEAEYLVREWQMAVGNSADVSMRETQDE